MENVSPTFNPLIAWFRILDISAQFRLDSRCFWSDDDMTVMRRRSRPNVLSRSCLSSSRDRVSLAHPTQRTLTLEDAPVEALRIQSSFLSEQLSDRDTQPFADGVQRINGQIFLSHFDPIIGGPPDAQTRCKLALREFSPPASEFVRQNIS